MVVTLTITNERNELQWKFSVLQALAQNSAKALLSPHTLDELRKALKRGAYGVGSRRTAQVETFSR